MDYCGPKGIPLSEFLSWSVDDQDAALSWQQRENRRCPGCGTHPGDWNETEGGSRYAWHGEILSCPGCAEQQRMQESPQMKDPLLRGMHVHLRPGAHAECVRCRPQK